MRGKGPDLAKVGADPNHTVEWLAEHIRNPKAHKPESRMPAFAGRISDDELKPLTEYLASLK
jgi:cbb3-type cytochrome oxidase cytochrome c subunit